MRRVDGPTSPSSEDGWELPERPVVSLADRISLVAHWIQIARLRAESWILAVIRRHARRIVVVAGWNFPETEEDFVYEEVSRWLEGDRAVRIFYGGRSRRRGRTPEVERLWGCRRRMSARSAAGWSSLQYFLRRDPEAVRAVLDDLAASSRRPVPELVEDPTVLYGFTVARLAAAFRAEYLHSYFLFDASLCAWLAARLTDVPYGLTCYDTDGLEVPENLFGLEQLRRCDAVMANGDALRADLRRLLGERDASRVVDAWETQHADDFPDRFLPEIRAESAIEDDPTIDGTEAEFEPEWLPPPIGRLGVEGRLAIALHRLQRIRLAAESRLQWLRPGRYRIAAMACWEFPIYSQTFVYQELKQLVARGHSLRLIYGEQRDRSDLPPAMRMLWRFRRRLSARPEVCRFSLLYFWRRDPEAVRRLLVELSQDSGMEFEELVEDTQVLQAFAFAHLVEAWRPAYLHSYFFYEGTLFARIAARLLGIPRGVSCYADHQVDDYRLKLVGHNVRECAVVVATSERIRRELLEAAGTRAPQIVVKPNAVDAACFPYSERPLPAADGPFEIVCVSRIEPKKGFIELVEALGLLRDRGRSMVAHVVGDPDLQNEEFALYARSVRERVADLGLGAEIRFHGKLSAAGVLEHLRRSQVFVAPFVETASGDKDGVPTALLEAMASGCPVVVTDAGSMTEVVSEAAYGVVVPQRSPVALADAIEALIDEPDRRLQLGASASFRVRRAFEVGTCERRFHERVERACAQTLASEAGSENRSQRLRRAGATFVAGLQAGVSGALRWLQRLGRILRVEDWFLYKIPPLLSVFYGLALIGDLPPTVALPVLGASLVGLLCVASFGYLINDLFDEKEDLAAGEVRPSSRVPRFLRVTALLVLPALGVACVVWAGLVPAARWLLAANFVLPILYSVPPIRLKERSLAGVAADALGAHGVPAAFVATAVAGSFDPSASSVTFAAAMVTVSFFVGLRGILAHQSRDRIRDQRAGVKTFGTRRSPQYVRGLILKVLWPVELAALTAALVVASFESVVVPLLIGAYSVVEIVKIRRGWTLPLVHSRAEAPERYVPLINNDLYEAWLPLALVLGLSLERLSYSWLVIAHTLVFLPILRSRLLSLMPIFSGPVAPGRSRRQPVRVSSLLRETRVIVGSPDWSRNDINESSQKLVRGLRGLGIDARILVTESATDKITPSPDPMPASPMALVENLPVSRTASWGAHWGALIRYLEERTPCIYLPSYDWRHSSAAPLLSARVGLVGAVLGAADEHFEHVQRLMPWLDRVVIFDAAWAEEIRSDEAGWRSRVRLIPPGVSTRSDAPRRRTGPVLRVVHPATLLDPLSARRVIEIVQAAGDRGARVELTVFGNENGVRPYRRAAEQSRGGFELTFRGALRFEARMTLFSRSDVLLDVGGGLWCDRLEAMARGCVAVSSAADRAPRRGEVAFSADDLEALAGLLVELSGDRRRLRRLSLEAWRGTLVDVPDFDQTLEAYVEMFEEVGAELAAGAIHRPAGRLMHPVSKGGEATLFDVELTHEEPGIGGFPRFDPDVLEFRRELSALSRSPADSSER